MKISASMGAKGYRLQELMCSAFVIVSSVAGEPLGCIRRWRSTTSSVPEDITNDTEMP